MFLILDSNHFSEELTDCGNVKNMGRKTMLIPGNLSPKVISLASMDWPVFWGKQKNKQEDELLPNDMV